MNEKTATSLPLAEALAATEEVFLRGEQVMYEQALEENRRLLRALDRTSAKSKRRRRALKDLNRALLLQQAVNATLQHRVRMLSEVNAMQTEQLMYLNEEMHMTCSLPPKLRRKLADLGI